MRLIRTVVQPANIALSRQLQHSRFIKTPTDLLHQVLVETSNREHGSNRQWFGRSYSASASSEPLETKKTRRRLSRHERKSMVEDFVNRYREMNAGKFPTTTEAINDVGGSYYVVREILQELVYNSKKVSPVANPKNGLEENKAIKKAEISSYTEKIITPTPKAEFVECSSKSFKSDQEPQCSISVEIIESKDVETIHEDEQKIALNLEPKHSKTLHEADEQKPDGSQSNAELQKSTEVSGRELDKVTTDNADHKTKSVWQNLKSFAMEIWKRY